MKALCLLLILANVSLFLWEYREGGFNDETESATHLAAPGVETIFLANEVEQDSELVGPEENQAGRGLDSEPAVTKITLPQPEQSITTPSSKADIPGQKLAPGPKTESGDTDNIGAKDNKFNNGGNAN